MQKLDFNPLKYPILFLISLFQPILKLNPTLNKPEILVAYAPTAPPL